MPFLAAGNRPPQVTDTIKPAAGGLLHILAATWEVWLFLGIVAVCRLGFQLYGRRRL